MKHSIVALIIVFLISSCNNEEKTPGANQIETISPEKIMRDDIAKYPDSILLKENLIQYYRDSSEYDKALDEINIALKKDSNNAKLWYIKGTLHFENEDTINSINAFEKAINILPDREYLKTLGSIYAETKNAKVLDLANVLQGANKSNIDKDALFLKGLYFNYIGEKQKAISFFDQCLSLDYTFMFAYREKAIAFYDLGKYEEALKVLDKALTMQNNFDEGYYWSGRCLEKLNRVNQAIEKYKLALLFNPDYVEAKAALAKLAK